MATVEKLIAGPTTWVALATKNDNTDAVATKAGATGMTHYVTHLSVSCSAAPSAAVSVTVSDGTTTFERLEIPAAAFAPVSINYVKPYRSASAGTITATFPAVGGTTRATIVVKGFSVSE